MGSFPGMTKKTKMSLFTRLLLLRITLIRQFAVLGMVKQLNLTSSKERREMKLQMLLESGVAL